MAPGEIFGIFLYGAYKLRLDERGLVPGAHDPDDLRAIGSLCVMVNEITDDGDTPFDGIMNALAVLGGALIAADITGMPVPHLVPKWHTNLVAASDLFLGSQPPPASRWNYKYLGRIIND